ncbi:MAG: IS4 family transposase, partial [Planctomycetes bacterium]|nr:IS4 family transposase [Planctomycetota bacterium]
MNNKYIGKERRELNKIFTQYGLIPLRKILTSEQFAKAAQESISWKYRQRIFTPEMVFWLMALVGINCDSMAGALRKAWEQIRPLDKDLPLLPASQAAFTKARKKFPIKFFQNLNDLVRNYFYQRYDLQRGSWKGLKVKMVDGTTLTLPESKQLRKSFGSRKNQNKQSSAPVQAHLVGLFWTFTGMCEGFALGSLRLGEKTGLIKLLALLKAGDLLLADRGFPGYDLCYAVMKRKSAFLFRLKKDVKPHRRKKLGPRDWLVVFKKPKNCRGKDLPEEITLRLIAYDLPGFRTAYLLTTLIDAEKYPREELISLYGQRWQIETRYNELKNMLKIENLRSLTKEGVMKEIITRITFGNLLNSCETPPLSLRATEGSEAGFLQSRDSGAISSFTLSGFAEGEHIIK